MGTFRKYIDVHRGCVLVHPFGGIAPQENFDALRGILEVLHVHS